jgi:hypothetical protein
MTRPRPSRFRVLTSLSLALCGTATGDESIRFNRDVLPILSDKCFHCHGPDAGSRKADLRLDGESFLTREAESGIALIAPGDPENSELIYRITTDDGDDVMPPPDDVKQLTSKEKETLAAWVKSGAAWEGHWAFVSAKRPPVPAAKEGTSPIDAFILQRLVKEHVTPGGPADPASWLRRAALDLTGLAPDPAITTRFLDDLDYGAAVDALLASPRYGERMTWDWLEAARYADTHGYQKDNLRSMWAWRDWVIKAFNDNKPFDQFTIEQLAGDLLPSPAPDQLIATGFNRNHRINAEAGAIDEEYRNEYVIDRVDTTATVWMGLTAGCSRCHDHKFDPLTQREFFEFAAFFNNIAEKGADGVAMTAAPEIEIDIPGFEQTIKEATETLTKTENEILTKAKDLGTEYGQWLTRVRTILASESYWLVTEPVEVKGDSADSTFTPLPDRSILFGGGIPLNDTHHLTFKTAQPLSVKAIRLEALPHTNLTRGSLSPSFNGDFLLSEIRLIINGNPVAFRSAKATVETADRQAASAIDGDPLSGWSVGGGKTDSVSAVFTLTERLTIDPADKIEISLAYLSREEQYFIGRFRVSLSVGDLPENELTQSLNAALLSGSPELLAREFRECTPALAALRKKRDLARGSLESARAASKTRVMVMRDRTGDPRPTHVLARGLYDQPGEEVSPNVPAFLSLPLPASDPPNRLALARWLVDPRHPLTARVTVNRIWQQFFGTGLVATPEDFGRQGEQPSHPELLDFLAVEFIESGWDTKALIRRLVLSDAYRRSSAIPYEMTERDPQNRLLARGPRKRLSAPAIRDQALQAGGLLVEKIGGPPVRPDQPGGLWEAVAGVNSNTTRYVADTGEGRFRRSLYTLWKRSVPPPNMFLFDAAGREVCSVGRVSTNTPLQALVTLNDPNFSLPALTFAGATLEIDSIDDTTRLLLMWRTLLVSDPSPHESEILLSALRDHRTRYAAAPELAAERTSPLSRSLALPEHGNPVELAAWTEIGEILLNLDVTLSPR